MTEKPIDTDEDLIAALAAYDAHMASINVDDNEEGRARYDAIEAWIEVASITEIQERLAQSSGDEKHDIQLAIGVAICVNPTHRLEPAFPELAAFSDPGMMRATCPICAGPAVQSSTASHGIWCRSCYPIGSAQDVSN